ncbi:MAG: leucyl aminopeptidase [Acidimicrobiia bacterium]|nr:leucyl aminopeptidase [Acidimicrobiia bacterium]
MIEISAAAAAPDVDALGIGLDADGEWDPAAAAVVAQLGDGFSAFLDQVDVTGKDGQVAVFPANGVDGVDHVIVVGLGDQVDADAVRRASGALARKASRAVTVASTLASRDVDGAGQAAAEGFLLGAYRYDRYRTSNNGPVTERVVLVGAGEADVSTGSTIAHAVALARDLVNTPSADKSPASVVDVALAETEGTAVRAVIHEGDALVDQRFGGLLGVAAGSSRPARMLELWYEPDAPKAFMAFVGKGITFDSGGLSLKPAAGMETMKTDMAGAAAVIGAIRAIAQLELPVKVLAITPLTDNMPSGSATKPGDVLTTRNGKTIEVLNTDAEGRLVLADGLTLASEQQPDVIVDLATLTGACKVALGEKIAGGFGTDEAFLERVIAAGRRVGERIWPLPLPDDYRTLIDSPIADMANTGGRFAGAITAALLLREFVDERPWVHVDIAGPARWPDDEHYQTKDGSGFGVRTLVALAQDFAEHGA